MDVTHASMHSCSEVTCNAVDITACKICKVVLILLCQVVVYAQCCAISNLCAQRCGVSIRALRLPYSAHGGVNRGVANFTGGDLHMDMGLAMGHEEVGMDLLLLPPAFLLQPWR